MKVRELIIELSRVPDKDAEDLGIRQCDMNERGTVGYSVDYVDTHRECGQNFVMLVLDRDGKDVH